MRALVVGDDLLEVPPGGEGELLVAGPQVSAGYWRDPERTAAAFVVPPGRREVHYRTGDRVRRPVGGGPLCFLGRRDHQIKVLGHRVELGEVEAALRDASGVDAVVAVGWPRTATGATGIVGFIGDTTVDGDRVLELVRGRLPSYMVPRELRVLAEIPLNANGKMDRGALLRSPGGPACPRHRLRRFAGRCWRPVGDGLAAVGLTPETAGDDLDLRESGVVDSLGFVELVVALEDQLGTELDLDRLDPERLTVVGALVELGARASSPGGVRAAS